MGPSDEARSGSEEKAMHKLEQTTASNLPAQLTPLIGREQEVAALCALLRRPEVRLLTLTGMGGIGKTRLSIEVALALLDDFVDGICFVPLAPISDPELVLPTIAQTLGLREAGDWPLLERLQSYLAGRHLLLLLDNFEQVTPAARHLGDLLASCPALKLLVTSRAVLHVRGEHEFQVTPLALPSLKNVAESSALSRYAAVALFVQRAQTIKPDFQLTPTNARTIAEICLRLDGLPLAIELAAARIKLLPPPALLARLEHRLHVLSSALRDVPERQQTLRSTLAWSYDLLNPEEQRLLRRLAVFVNGCTLAAAEAVAGSDSLPVLDGLSALIDQSLLQQREQEDGEPRFTLLETIREYAWERLMEHGEAEAAQRKHARCFLALAEQAEPHLRSDGQNIWFDRLENDHENLRAALRWFAEQQDAESVLRLGGALWWFWWVRGYISEGRSFLEPMLQAGEQTASLIRARALNAAGTLATLQGDLAQAERLCHESLALFRALKETQDIITALWMLGYVGVEQSNYARAKTALEEALALSRQTGNAWGIAYSLEILAAAAFNQGGYLQARPMLEEGLAIARASGDTEGISRLAWLLGLVLFTLGEQARAHTTLEESLTLSRHVGDKRGIAYSLIILSYLSVIEGSFTTTHAWLEESLALLKEIGDRRGIAWALYGLGWLALVQQAPAEARSLFEESLALLQELGHKWFMSLCAEGLAGAIALQGNAAWAARLWGAAESFRKESGASLPPVAQPMYAPLIAEARGQLGSDQFAALLAEGREMSLQAALADERPAPAASETPAARPSAPIYPAGLTAREVEVLRLVAKGLKDNEVAEELVISRRTVSTHLTSIYNKLGVNTRSAATRFAVEHHLL
jgi:predicted ATPase/DNA-binding CsgD family transcriptional regulator